MDRLIVIWTPHVPVENEPEKPEKLKINFIANIDHLSLKITNDKTVELTETIPGFIYNSKSVQTIYFEKMEDLVKF